MVDKIDELAAQYGQRDFIIRTISDIESLPESTRYVHVNAVDIGLHNKIEEILTKLPNVEYITISSRLLNDRLQGKKGQRLLQKLADRGIKLETRNLVK